MDSDIVYYVDDDHLFYFEYKAGDYIPDDELFKFFTIIYGKNIIQDIRSI
jgi:hypothetical protein